MWDLLFKFIDGDTNIIDTIKRESNTKRITNTRPSPEIFDMINQLVERHALFTKSILEQINHIDKIISNVLNKYE